MLIIKIELHPSDGSKPTTLHQGIIYNDGTGTNTLGNYVFRFLNKRGVAWSQGTVSGFRRRSKNAWCLLHKCLKKSVEKI